MADKPKKKRILKNKTETVRQKAQAVSDAPVKKRHIRRTATKITTPIKAVHRFGKKEYYLPMPDNKFGRFMNKKRYIIPRYLRESWQEVKQVTWPDRKETTKLTLAVFTFAIIFGILVAVVDYGLDIIFRKTILK
ncbi:MAG: preprotein translocase subunit SecE [Candidatus Saccharibacteria bacterium]|jgi:preprotein translocase subunit SecE